MEKHLIIDFSSRTNEDANLTAFYKDPNNATYGREPVIARMKNGTLICVFLTGGATEPHNKNVVLIKKSYDDGKSWTNSEVLFSHSHLGLWSTEIFTEAERPMIIISMYDGTCPFKMLQTFVSYTDDNGESFTRPTMADPSFCTASVRRGIRLSNGDILFPIYYTMADDCLDWNVQNANKPGFWKGTHHECAVAISHDNGKSYTRFGRMNMAPLSLWENNCAEVSPGHIKMYMRADGPQSGKLAVSDSFDFGRTWTEPILSDIDNPGSKISVFTYKDKLCLIANFDPKERTHLQLRTSKDGGNTFYRTVSIDDDSAFFCYPHVILCEENKTLYIAYENYRQHYLKKLTFEEAGL